MHAVTTLVLLWTALGFLLLLPCAVLMAEVVSALTARPAAAGIDGQRPAVAIIVPAHDEAPILAQTLRLISQQLEERDRLIVVADNCSDRTAAIATAAGAEALERTDALRRGKGYALDFALRHLAAAPREVVIIIDADCSVMPGALAALARQCGASRRPVQARYRLEAPEGAGLAIRMKAFACALKNEARPLGLHRIGLPCQLVGSGMAFPWRLIQSARLASGEIVEDLQLGIELAGAGAAPLFCPAAVVISQLPVSREGIHSQRARWEHGHLAAIMREGPRLLARSVAHADRLGVGLALDLMVPPLALLLLLIGGHWLVSLVLYAVFAAILPLFCSSCAAVLLACAVLLAWRGYGRQLVSFRSLALAPVYALAKLPLYGKFFRARQRIWVRSRRDHEA